MQLRILKPGFHIFVFTVTAWLSSASLEASAQTKLLRFPDIHGSKIVFCYAGDLWLSPSDGGSAARLTAHPGIELFPKFSPDGKWIAFTGQYDGDEQVYVISSQGGIPRQLTFYPARGPLPPRWGYDNQVYGWIRDGGAVVFRSMRYGWDLTDTRLFTVPVTGGLPIALPMPVSGAGDISPDGMKVVYSPLVRDFRTWKRYQGGWAQDLYIFDLQSNEALQITNHPRSDRDPMWIGNKIYFTSDRDGTLNIYSYDPESNETLQVTRSTSWDVRWPSADEKGQIVYELNGELNILDTHTGESKSISIFVPNDGVAMRPSRVSASKLIEYWGLSPKGERALFAARGDIFTAPIKKGPTRNLTHSSNAHDKWPSWSPDGSKIAFISDADGEEEIYLIDQNGSGEPVQLTDGGRGMRYRIKWAPDSKRLAFSDKNGKIYVLTIENKKLEEIADERAEQVFDYVWSPNGGHLAFSLSDETRFNSIYIWSVKEGRLRRITGPMFNEFNPAWDPEGNYLYYMSDRQFAPQIGSIEWNYVVDRETDIFALALRKDVKHPFPPESDEVTIKEDDEEEEKDKKEEKEDKKKKKYIKIDFDGLAKRVARVPVAADNYYGLNATKNNLLYVRGTPFYYGRRSGSKSELKIFSLKDREENTLAEDVSGYSISYDGSKVLVRQGKEYNLYDAKSKAKDSKKKVSTEGLQVDRIPAEEWAQVFGEVWRRFRDFFYVENMHGYDWEALRQQYRPLLEYVAHRSDLNYVMGEMVAELNVSHAYISGGDYSIPKRPKAALAGVRFALEQSSGRYQIAGIFSGQNEEERYRSPLTEIGVEAHVGDYILAIDGEELTPDVNPYRLLLHKSDRLVELTLNGRPRMKGARKVTFRPIASERNLIYLGWVEKNRKYVSENTGDRIGYMHIPNMGSSGIREFIKWYYGQIRKEGLIIDVRGNGGGNVSQMLIERLGRKLLSVDYSRNCDYAYTYPRNVYAGHLVCLLNETSASDGDIFPAMFKKAGLGKLIGKRSWGGVIGYTGHGSLIDGGSVFVPEYGFISTEGSWDLENFGVEPDIMVENDPKSVIEGKDPQLDRGIKEVMKMIRERPKSIPPRPPAPVKTK